MSSTNRGAKRMSADLYPTPMDAIDSIMLEIDWDKVDTVLEPAAGDGRILRKCKERNPEIITDWAETNPPERFGAVPRDYLTTEYPPFSLVITNPPFSLAQEFVEKALKDGMSVAMLLRLGFLGSQKRNVWWRDRSPSRLFVLSKRPSFTGKGTDSADYAWFCWGPAFIRPPGVYCVL
jgi:hypothetical protein